MSKEFICQFVGVVVSTSEPPRRILEVYFTSFSGMFHLFSSHFSTHVYEFEPYVVLHPNF